MAVPVYGVDGTSLPVAELVVPFGGSAAEFGEETADLNQFFGGVEGAIGSAPTPHSRPSTGLRAAHVVVAFAAAAFGFAFGLVGSYGASQLADRQLQVGWALAAALAGAFGFALLAAGMSVDQPARGRRAAEVPLLRAIGLSLSPGTVKGTGSALVLVTLFLVAVPLMASLVGGFGGFVNAPLTGDQEVLPHRQLASKTELRWAARTLAAAIERQIEVIEAEGRAAQNSDVLRRIIGSHADAQWQWLTVYMMGVLETESGDELFHAIADYGEVAKRSFYVDARRYEDAYIMPAIVELQEVLTGQEVQLPPERGPHNEVVITLGRWADLDDHAYTYMRAAAEDYVAGLAREQGLGFRFPRHRNEAGYAEIILVPSDGAAFRQQLTTILERLRPEKVRAGWVLARLPADLESQRRAEAEAIEDEIDWAIAVLKLPGHFHCDRALRILEENGPDSERADDVVQLALEEIGCEVGDAVLLGVLLQRWMLRRHVAQLLRTLDPDDMRQRQLLNYVIGSIPAVKANDPEVLDLLLQLLRRRLAEPGEMGVPEVLRALRVFGPDVEGIIYEMMWRGELPLDSTLVEVLGEVGTRRSWHLLRTLGRYSLFLRSRCREAAEKIRSDPRRSRAAPPPAPLDPVPEVELAIERLSKKYSRDQVVVVRCRLLQALANQSDFADGPFADRRMAALRRLLRSVIFPQGDDGDGPNGELILIPDGYMVYAVAAPCGAVHAIANRISTGFVEGVDEQQRVITWLLTEPVPERFAGERPDRFAGGALDPFGAGQGGGDSIEAALAALESGDSHDRAEACRFLARTKVDEKRRAEVSKALCDAALSGDRFVQREALRALRKWGTEDIVPRLAPLLTNFFLQEEAALVIAQFKTPRAARAFARLLLSNNSRDRELGARGLVELGPVAEPIVLDFLREGAPELQYICCLILQEIGTEESVKVLRNLLRRRLHPRLKNMIRLTISTITRRLKLEQLTSEPEDDKQTEGGSPVEEVQGELEERDSED